MATIEQQKQITEQFKNVLQKQFLAITIDELTREPELGNTLSFKKGEALFVKTINLFKRVSEVDLSDVPYNLLQACFAQLNNALAIFTEIKSFNPNSATPGNQRDAIIARLESQFDNYYTHALPLLTVGILTSNDLAVERHKLNDSIQELTKDREKTKNEAAKYLDEIKDVLAKARQAAVEVGVAQHSFTFKEEADEHKRLSSIWLGWTIGVLVLIAGAALLFIAYFPNTGTDTSSYIVQYSITKIVVLTAMFFGLSICNRNYKAHKHNSILNKHRQNALNTFETFSKAAGSDAQTKNAVLLEATHTIFSNQQTGYLQNENEDSSNKIIEIIKGVASSDK